MRSLVLLALLALSPHEVRSFVSGGETAPAQALTFERYPELIRRYQKGSFASTVEEVPVRRGRATRDAGTLAPPGRRSPQPGAGRGSHSPLRTAIEIRPGWQVLYVAVSYAHHRLGDQRASAEVAKRGLRLLPETGQAQGGRWAYHLKLRVFIEAVLRLRKGALE